MTDSTDDTMKFEAGDTPMTLGLPVTAPVTPPPVVLPPGWDMPKVLNLIDALARNLYDEAYVIQQYGLTKAEYDLFQQNQWFKSTLERQQGDWNKAENVNQRLAIQSALIVEKNMPALSQRLGSKTEPLAAVVALVKVMTEMAGVTGNLANKQQEAPRERFKIIFNLGADVQAFDKEKPLVQIQGSDNALQSLFETPGVPAPVQTDPKGS